MHSAFTQYFLPDSFFLIVFPYITLRCCWVADSFRLRFINMIYYYVVLMYVNTCNSHLNYIRTFLFTYIHMRRAFFLSHSTEDSYSPHSSSSPFNNFASHFFEISNAAAAALFLKRTRISSAVLCQCNYPTTTGSPHKTPKTLLRRTAKFCYVYIHICMYISRNYTGFHPLSTHLPINTLLISHKVIRKLGPNIWTSGRPVSSRPIPGNLTFQE